MAVTVAFVDPNDRVTPLLRRDRLLVSPAGDCFPIIDGIPDFTGRTDAGQEQTSRSFGFKWTHQPEWGFRPEHQPVMRAFWTEIFDLQDWSELEAMFRDRVVLDAGCGSGASLNQFADWPRSIAAVDISEAVYVCRNRFAERANIAFARADLMRLPFPERAFDLIWSAGVLHHTPNTFESLRALVRHLSSGGRVIFYVYVKKAPLREYADDLVRQQIAHLAADEAWRRMEAITMLGRSLSALGVDLVIERDVPELGFKAGRYDLQRFVYYHIFKCYWNDGMPFDDNVHVNFDWYHPVYAHRHTPEEVRGWLGTLNLVAERFKVSDSGIGVVARLN
jgi:SAM-dependent methyltransferase